MAQSRAVIARRRRLCTRGKEVHAALDGTDKAGVSNAVAGALDALYDLWEYWRQSVALTMDQADERLRGDVDGETTAALVHARGAKPTFLKTSDTSRIPTGIRTVTTTGSGVGKMTQILARALPLVMAGTPVCSSRRVPAPLEAALRWMSTQPELQ
jgi:hypothetical protein